MCSSRRTTICAVRSGQRVHGQAQGLGGPADAVAARPGVGEEPVLGPGQASTSHERRGVALPRQAHGQRRPHASAAGSPSNTTGSGGGGVLMTTLYVFTVVESTSSALAPPGSGLVDLLRGRNRLPAGIARLAAVASKGKSASCVVSPSSTRRQDAVHRARVHHQPAPGAEGRAVGAGRPGGPSRVGRSGGLGCGCWSKTPCAGALTVAQAGRGSARCRAGLLQRVHQVVGEGPAALQAAGAGKGGLAGLLRRQAASRMWRPGGR